jgi:hypothetical protein
MPKVKVGKETVKFLANFDHLITVGASVPASRHAVHPRVTQDSQVHQKRPFSKHFKPFQRQKMHCPRPSLSYDFAINDFASPKIS